MADTLDDKARNPDFCFPCLHYSVSEGAGVLRVKIVNKTGKEIDIGVRTVDSEAVSGKDFDAIDQIIEWKKTKKREAEVSIKIIDDENWEPDEDFFVELYDVNTRKKLVGEDTRTRITIMDDDRPGMLSFKEKKQVRHPADQSECRITISRTHGADGDISVEYATYELDNTTSTATAGLDFDHVSGTLHFQHREVEKDIVVPILHRDDLEEDAKRDEVFGVKISNPQPSVVKISKKDRILVEIVTDAETKKQAEAL